MNKETRHCAILFADVAGSTHLYETLGDEVAQEAISQRLLMMAEIIESFQGIVVKTVGDEIMARFERADYSIKAACSIQEASVDGITEQNLVLSEHIGVHYGPTILMGGDVFGDAVNVAARLTTVARSGQIITSQETLEMLSQENVELTREFDTTTVKGRSRPVVMYEVLWEEEAVVTGIHEHGLAHQERDQPLLLRFLSEERTLQPASVTLIGRSRQCDLIIQGDSISRLHAFIEYRHGKFVFRDQSTNGTYIRIGNDRSIFLRREELPLWGTGVISLGRPVRKSDKRLIYFDAHQEAPLEEAEVTVASSTAARSFHEHG